MMTRLRVRRPTGDDGVAIVMVLAYMAILTTLMLAMLAVVIGQVKPTAQARKDIGSVNAASSGLQAGLTEIRSALDSTGEGNRGRLPCTAGDTASFRTGADSASTPGARIQGTAADLPGDFTYDVSVAYYLDDPTDQSPAWLKSNAMNCPLHATPLYAYLQSYGTGAAVVAGTGNFGNRSQTGVYQFSVPQENIAGGRLRSYGTTMCLDAGSATPAAGQLLYTAACQDAGTPQQLFVYRNDLSLFFGGAPSLNLCIQASAGQQPQLQRCTGTGNGSTYAYAPGQQVQEWGFNDNGHFAAAADDGNVSGSCLQPATDAAGAQLVFTGCSGSTTGWEAFDPDPSVGAGKAGGNTSGQVGPPTQQYVNFLEFGRCLDVTGQNVDADHLIAYPCKQAPNSGFLTWNQVWHFDITTGKIGTFYTIKSGVQYCLTAPVSGALILTKPCTSPVLPNQEWTSTGVVAGSPETSYNLISASRNQCMSVSRDGALTFGSANIVLEPCTGALAQRWNAPPPPPTSGLNNIREGTAVRRP